MPSAITANPIAVLVIFAAGSLIGIAIGYFFRGLRLKQNLLQLQLDHANQEKNFEVVQMGLEKEIQHLQKSLLDQTEGTKSQINLMEQKFEVLSQKIFEDKSTRFTDLNLKNLTHLLDPLKERIKDFERKVEDAYSQEKTERNLLRGELNRLMDLNKVMSLETEQLTKALKGENKTQGNWGELILESILERSGLRKSEEYFVQETLRGENGEILRPDVIVKLPGEKCLIVDSKMTLNAYEGYSSCASDEEQKRWAKMHVDALKRHIDGLSEKRYHLAQEILTPDFVILFMPLEPAFALAFREKPDIFQDAWEKNIAIVSPTTLLTTLRTVSVLWKQERQQKNALDIAKRGGLLHDKFANLIKDFMQLGEKLQSAQDFHGDLMKKMSQGKGNLIEQVNDLKRLGAKAEKSLPQIEQDIS